MDEELKVVITAEVGKFKENIKQAKEEVKKFGGSSKISFKEFNDSFQKVGDASKKVLKVFSGAVAGAAGSLIAVNETTKEYRENQAKLATAFEVSGSSAKTAKDVYNDLYRVLGDDDVTTEASSNLAKITDSEKDLSQWTKICEGAFATYGDSLPIESLTEASNETIKVGAVTGALADALNWAGVSEDGFNEKLAACNNEAEREKLVRETLNGLYGEAAEKYEKNNKELLAQQDAERQMKDAMAELAQVLAPLFSDIASFSADTLPLLLEPIQDFIESHKDEIQDFLKTVSEKVQEVIGFISENWETISTIGGIILGIAAALTVLSGILTVVNTIMATSPTTWVILGIVAAVAALTAAIIFCVKHWDEIKAKVAEVVEKIKEKVTEMKEKVSEKFEEIKTAISEKIEAIKGFFRGVLDWLKENWAGLLLLIVNPFAGAFKLAYDNCESFRTKVNDFVEKIKQFFKDGFEKVKTNIITPIKEAKDKVIGKFEEIKEGISDKLEAAKKKVSDVIEKIKKLFNFKWSLPKLKMPHFKATGSFSLKPPISVPKISVDWYANGGVFDKPTLFGYGNGIGGLGENGAEAVVPLENNLGWLDKLATMLADKTSKNQPIVLTVDGKVFATTAVDTINQLTKQTGSLQLRLV